MLKVIGIKGWSAAAVAVSLTACGGGGGSGGSSPSNSGAAAFELVIDNPRSNSAAQLTQAYDQKINAAKGVNTQQQQLSPAAAQQRFQYMFAGDLNFLNAIDADDFLELPEGTAVDETVSCDLRGQATVSGTVNYESDSVVEVVFTNCEDFDFALDGRFSIRFKVLTDTSFSYDMYFDDLVVSDSAGSVRVSGYRLVSNTEDYNNGLVNNDTTTHLLITDLNTSESSVDDIVFTSEWEDDVNNISLTGSLWTEQEGSVAVDVEIIQNYDQGVFEESLEFTGTNAVRVENFFSPNVRYLEDTDGSGEFDSGVYISGAEWFEGDNLALELVAVDELSLPPEAYSGPSLQSYDVTTLDEVVVVAGSYGDPDTPNADLEVSFRWYLNGELLEDYIGNTLPAGIAVFGDQLEVSMLVSDGTSSIESYRNSIYLNDSPASLRLLNKPAQVTAGDLVEFTVELYDADLSDSAVAPAMTSAPNGASIDDSGFVSWQTPSSGSFLPQTAYQFVFSSDSISEPLMLELLVENPAANMPIVRSGIEVPYSNYSMWVGDYDGNGDNELLTMDNGNKVFILSDVNGSYQQTWMYPFAMPTSGRLQQTIRIEGQPQDQILVVTEHGLSLIDGLDRAAAVILETDSYIHFAAVADTNNDGRLEIAYLYSNSDYGSDKNLAVINLDDSNVLIDISVANATEVAFGNVDTDAALELVVSSGYVFDGATWANEWFRGSGFGSYLAVGDFNNDGIDEIAGSANWADMSVYSAESKDLVATIADSDVCSVVAGQIDSTPEIELLIGYCQSGGITAYNLSGSSLVEVVSFDIRDSSKSIVVGDSDNDGLVELHWGTGQNHTGEDVFVVADGDNQGNFTIRESAAPQLGSFSVAGWSTLTPSSDELAVFFTPQTQSGYGDSAIITLDTSGKVDVLAELSSNWDNSRYAYCTDFNQDGFGDIFVPTTETYSGAFSALQLSDQSVHWEVDADSSDRVGVVLAADMNGDGFDDALYETGDSVTIVDLISETLIASYSVASYIRDYSTVSIEDQSYLVLASDNLALFDVSSSTQSAISSIGRACSRVDAVNVDDDPQLEVVCLEQTEWYDDLPTTVFVYEVSETGFSEKMQFDAGVGLVDFVANTASDNEQTVFVLTSEENNDYPYNNWSTLAELDINSGSLIWQSPRLIGQARHRGLRFRADAEGADLLIATDQAMYWLNP